MVGTQDELQPKFERRLFFMRTLPLVTLVMGSVVGLLFIFVWLRRRQEVLYGLFGLAAVLWAARTTNLLVDALPATVWPAWRLLYHATNGGFVICMALFSLSLAGWLRPAVARSLAAYPVESLRKNKYWVPVGRADNVYGDRNLFCSCLPVAGE